MEIKHTTWPLPNVKPIKAEEFWHHASIWGMKASTYVQRRQDEDMKGWFTPLVFEINSERLIGGGFLVKCFYSGSRAGEQEFFTYVECDHEFEGRKAGNCYHIYTCKKCQARYDVDSSD